MKRKPVRTLLLLGVVLALLAPSAPAHATTVARLTFVGELITSRGLGAPCLEVGSCVGGPPVNFTFSTTTCSGHKVDVLELKGTGVHGPFCWVWMSGTGRGNCGVFQGTGSAILRFSDGTNEKWISARVNILLAGTTATFNGEGEKEPGYPQGTLNGEAEVIASPSGGSCLNGTQSRFILAGEMQFTKPI